MTTYQKVSGVKRSDNLQNEITVMYQKQTKLVEKKEEIRWTAMTMTRWKEVVGKDYVSLHLNMEPLKTMVRSKWGISIKGNQTDSN